MSKVDWSKLSEEQIFQKLVASVLKHEGGYVNDPNDPGGETNFGISKRAYPHLDIKKLTKEQAIEIYRRDYYSVVQFIKDISLRSHVFDMAVNAGVSAAMQLYNRTDKNFNSYMWARSNYYRSLKGFPIYGKAWFNRIETTIV